MAIKTSTTSKGTPPQPTRRARKHRTPEYGTHLLQRAAERRARRFACGDEHPVRHTARFDRKTQTWSRS